MNLKYATFRGGIHPPYKKELTQNKELKRASEPEMVVIPMSLHIGAPCDPLVKKGDKVEMGQRIGEAKGFISAPIHSSVSGEVIALEPRLHPNGQKVLSVVIKSDGKNTLHESIKPNSDIGHLSAKEIKDIVFNAGIVGLGGASFPTHVKLSPPPEKRINTIIINGAECEPYLTSDDYLMKNFPEKIICGLKAIMKCLNVQKAYIGIEDNKKEAIDSVGKALLGMENVEIFSLHTKYPQGSEKQLITAITGIEVPSGGLPADIGVVVSNVATAAAISDAIQTGMPLIERIVTVTGSAIREPSVLKVKIGTIVKDLIEQCGGFTEEPMKVINGGPMMGIAQYSVDIPIIKGTNAILCLTKSDAKVSEPKACIRCGKCVEVCPVNLLPLYICEYSLKNNFEKCEKYRPLDCIECGNCSYICPAKRTLVSSIRVAKREIISKSKKGK